MTQDARSELLREARRYIWWESPEEAIRRPERVIAQVMNLGDYEDVQQLVAVLGLTTLREALLHAEPGWFNEKSWFYWCYRLGIAAPGEVVPPLPQRAF